MSLQYNQRQRYLSQQKPPPWLLCGTWDELVHHHRHRNSYTTEQQVGSHNKWTTTIDDVVTRTTSLSEDHKFTNHFHNNTKNCTERGTSSYSDDETSVVAYSHVTKDGTNYSPVLQMDDIQCIMKKYLAMDSQQNRGEPTETTVWCCNEKQSEKEEYSMVSQVSQRREYGQLGDTYQQPLSKKCSSIKEKQELQSHQALHQVVVGESFQHKDVAKSLPEENVSCPKWKPQKAPPFRKTEPKPSQVDWKLRDQLLVEIRSGRDRLRSTPQKKRTHSQPLSLREQLMQEIRVGKELHRIE